MGEALDVLVEAPSMHPLDCLDDGGVKRAAPVLKKASIGYVVGQGVLERVLEVWEQPRLIEKLAGLEGGETAAERFLRPLGESLKERERHVLTKNGRGLEESFVLRRESVDAGGQNRLGRRRDLQGLRRLRQPVGPSFPREDLRLDQRPDALLEEEGIALRPLDQHSLERLQPSGVSKQGLEKCLGALRGQGVDAELSIIRLVPPAVTVLRSVVHGEQQAGSGQTLHHAVEEGLGLRVDPVQILEHQQEWLDL